MADDRWDFFIAYASPDRRAAETLHDLLSPVFRVFLDRRSLLPGDDWARRLSAAQGGAAVTLVLISPRTDAAYYQREEIARALDLARREDDPHRVVPVLLDAPGDPVDLPYGLRLKHGVSVTDAGGLSGVADLLKSTLRPWLAMSTAEIRSRHLHRAPVRRAVRLVPSRSFDRDGRLGPPVRAYVFVGDHDEQRHRTLRQVLSNLWIGDAFERVENSDVPWTALTFELGELNQRKLDLMPATWKAVFRILSDPERAARFTADADELARLGPPPRDYYSPDQAYWYNRCTAGERRYPDLTSHHFLRHVLGLDWFCFSGDGITASTETPSRVFLVRNVPLDTITYRVQHLGAPDDDIHLD
ncbi:toll/interleukin-1 receptor domain-containing protein [Saccharothrix saharensis]|uniref:toll/interleukin-1 receptor domain-containing protein n=1 Tax=Saccharothrix saharensis TaxID=571190 RepID=UPI0036944C2C